MYYYIIFFYRNVEASQDSIIIQIKILMDVPQYIWSSIENKDLLFATQLYLIAQHINYSLLFEVGSTDLSIKYPIVSKQWDVISQFKNIILNKCNNVLQSLDVQPGVSIYFILYYKILYIIYNFIMLLKFYNVIIIL